MYKFIVAKEPPHNSYIAPPYNTIFGTPFNENNFFNFLNTIGEKGNNLINTLNIPLLLDIPK